MRLEVSGEQEDPEGVACVTLINTLFVLQQVPGFEVRLSNGSWVSIVGALVLPSQPPALRAGKQSRQRGLLAQRLLSKDSTGIMADVSEASSADVTISNGTIGESTTSVSGAATAGSTAADSRSLQQETSRRTLLDTLFVSATVPGAQVDAAAVSGKGSLKASIAKAGATVMGRGSFQVSLPPDGVTGTWKGVRCVGYHLHCPLHLKPYERGCQDAPRHS